MAQFARHRQRTGGGCGQSGAEFRGGGAYRRQRGTRTGCRHSIRHCARGGDFRDGCFTRFAQRFARRAQAIHRVEIIRRRVFALSGCAHHSRRDAAFDRGCVQQRQRFTQPLIAKQWAQRVHHANRQPQNRHCLRQRIRGVFTRAHELVVQSGDRLRGLYD